MTLSLKLRVSHRFSFRSKNTKFMTNTFQRGLCFSKRNGFPHRQFSIAFRGGHISFSVAHACRAAMVCAAALFLPTSADLRPACGVCEVQNHSSLESTELTSLSRREDTCVGIIPTDMQRLTALGMEIKNKEQRTENIEPQIINRKPQTIHRKSSLNTKC